MALDSKDFDPIPVNAVLDILKGDNSNFFLVGGQAVNFWASKYLENDPKLYKFQPFVSKDADLFTDNRDEIRDLSTRLNAKVKFSPPRTIGLAYIDTLKNDKNYRFEFLKSVNGLDQKDFEITSLIKYGATTIKVLDPPVLLKAKLANGASIDQKSRQDLKHLKMCIISTSHFLNEMVEKKTERQALEHFKYTHKVINSSKAQLVAKNFAVDFSPALPSVDQSFPPKIQRWAQNLEKNTKE